MSDNLKQRITVVLAASPRTVANRLRAALVDVLAEVAKEGICVRVLNWYLHGADSNDEQSSTEPDACGTCIVCVAREVTGDSVNITEV